MRLASALVAAFTALGRRAAAVPADGFWRDASIRLEHGRTDADAYRTAWLDTQALAREVLDPLGPDGDRRYLPALRDPVTNRSARVPYRTAAVDGVVLVAGAFLLGGHLDFDVTIHLALDAAARARRTPADQAWTLPAWDAYDREVRPGDRADVAVRWNDADHPAIGIRNPG
ncbi:MAG: uridine kinase [Actinomycetota bacterium]|nr:uridine kinase [Actinomycetota bacterium]